MSVKIKICGITSEEDSVTAIMLGADAVGFNFTFSNSRRVLPDVARKIVKRLPPFVQAVGIFRNDRPDWINRVIDEVGLAAVQLRGDEAPEFCGSLRVPVIKELNVASMEDAGICGRFSVSAFLLKPTNGAIPKKADGAVSKYEPMARMAEALGCVVLPGDCLDGDIAEAVRVIKPYAVDISMVAEGCDGGFDFERLRRFIEEVKNA